MKGGIKCPPSNFRCSQAPGTDSAVVQQVFIPSNGLAVFPRIALSNDYRCAESNCPRGRRGEFGSLERKQGARAGPIFPSSPELSCSSHLDGLEVFAVPSFDPRSPELTLSHHARVMFEYDCCKRRWNRIEAFHCIFLGSFLWPSDGGWTHARFLAAGDVKLGGSGSRSAAELNRQRPVSFNRVGHGLGRCRPQGPAVQGEPECHGYILPRERAVAVNLFSYSHRGFAIISPTSLLESALNAGKRNDDLPEPATGHVSP